LESGLDIVARLEPVSYVSRTSGQNEIGLVAEDVHAAEPRLTTFDTKGKIVGVDYGHVAAVAVRAVQELESRIKLLEERLKSRE
jgi:hypothetical protein